MLIKKCDRCGTVYEPYNERNNSAKTNGFILLNIDTKMQYYKHAARDLCPSCMEQLHDWLDFPNDYAVTRIKNIVSETVEFADGTRLEKIVEE